MAEEVSYASVVFKSQKQAPREGKQEEETVYDEVKGKIKTTEQTADTNVATLSHESDITGLNHLKENITTLLADIHNLKNLNNNLTVQLGNLTQNYTILESKITNLTTQNQELKNRTQELEMKRNNLTEQIQNMEMNWNKLNISRAQWSINAYCPKNNNVRRCKPCQKGWEFTEPSCYGINNANGDEQKTWEEAREDCRGKISDLAVVHTEQEKGVINGYSWGRWNAYWIGLRVEDGKWKWIDGTELNQSSWIEAPTEGHCAFSVHSQGWKSAMCNEKKQWICEKEALSV
ncbi:C-type lectin domain family 4 member G-like isoform X2 [Anoplopoma fimbria]|uniref:C-type lectin domain family 4 member G-like isoform X2 n=1 Tax=Anoplopoma fimbria TaxID=229290 RepID=UPI0023EB6E7E|nr:C-type lectin domain family 4 member G-like isoform X2 [Anoplopoma fimbria]